MKRILEIVILSFMTCAITATFLGLLPKTKAEASDAYYVGPGDYSAVVFSADGVVNGAPRVISVDGASYIVFSMDWNTSLNSDSIMTAPDEKRYIPFPKLYNYLSENSVKIIARCMAIFLVYYVILAIANWRIFKKAGRHAWFSPIPIVNLWNAYSIVTGKGYNMFLLLIPVFGIIYGIFIYNWKLTKTFGKSLIFYLGLLLLNPIFIVILGYDNSYYLGDKYSYRW